VDLVAGEATIHHWVQVRKAGSAAWAARRVETSCGRRRAHGANGAHLDRAAYKSVDGIVVSKDTSKCFVSTSTGLVGTALESFESGHPVSWRGDDLRGISSISSIWE
jgi:hypothetical protein